jgi:hypothetical protein
MDDGEDSIDGGASAGQIAVLVAGLALAFALGFLIMRVLPIWLGLPLLIALVVAARYYRIRTSRPGSR